MEIITDTAGLRLSAQRFRAYSRDISDEVDGVRQYLAFSANAWHGDAAVAFRDAAGRWVESFDQMAAMLQGVADDLERVAENYEQTDSAVDSGWRF